MIHEDIVRELVEMICKNGKRFFKLFLSGQATPSMPESLAAVPFIPRPLFSAP
jgi:hypothetical protein